MVFVRRRPPPAVGAGAASVSRPVAAQSVTPPPGFAGTQQEIDSFLRGTMGREARAEWVEHLRTDAAFRAQVREQRERTAATLERPSDATIERFGAGCLAMIGFQQNAPGASHVSGMEMAPQVVGDRQRFAAEATAAFEWVLSSGERLEDLALENLDRVRANVATAKAAESSYRSTRATEALGAVSAAFQGGRRANLQRFVELPRAFWPQR